jgi:hypothetical protein
MSVFTTSAVLVALNHHDPAIRLERITALAGLVEHFAIELDFDEDRFVGLIDAMPRLRAEMALA